MNTFTHTNDNITTVDSDDIHTISRRRRVVTAGLAAAVVAVGLSATSVGATAPRLAGQPAPVVATPVRFTNAAPGSTGTANTTFDALASGALTVSSPDPALFTVTSISSSIVTTTVVDTSGDLLPGQRTTKPLYSTTLTPDGWVAGGGPLNVAAGERIQVQVSVTAPATTPVTGINELLTVHDGGVTSTIPVSVSVVSVWAELQHPFMNTDIHAGQTLTVPIVIHSVSGPDTDVVIDSVVVPDFYGFVAYGVGTAPMTVHVAHGDAVVYLQVVSSYGASAGDHNLYIRMTAFGNASKVGNMDVRIVP